MAEIVTEKIVSVIGMGDNAPGSPETKLKSQASELEFRAEAMIVSNNQEYQEAAEFGRAIKSKAAEVTAFFKPMKDAANKAHREICAREKAMLEPLNSAEKILKASMGTYYAEQERKRRAAEEAARRAAQEEANRKLAEAIALEAQGKRDEADSVVEDAEVYDDAAAGIVVAPSTPKVKGVASKKDWEITSIDSGAVPTVFTGIELRPVDRAAVMRLIRASKGSIQIPGVQYKETTSMSFSRR